MISTEREPDCILAEGELSERLCKEHEVLAPKRSRLTELIDRARMRAFCLVTIHLETQVVHAGVSELGLNLQDLKKRDVVLGDISGANVVPVGSRNTEHPRQMFWILKKAWIVGFSMMHGTKYVLPYYRGKASA